MSVFASRSGIPFLPRSYFYFVVVCLFCALGIASALVIMSMVAPEDLNWVLTHIE
jgi:hypothetical protein